VASFSRRNRAVLIGSLGVIVALAIGLVLATREARRANDASRDATSEAESAYAIGEFLSTMTSAVSAYDRGEDVRVVDMLEQGEARLDEVSDPRAATVARAVVGAGFLNLGRLQRARELLVPAVERLEALVPGDAPTRLQAEAALAQLLEQEGRFDEAIRLARRILPRAEARFGPGTALPCTVQRTLGVALQRSGSLDEAEAVFRAVMPSYERNRARNARPLATMHNLLGQIHLARHELEAGERELVAARELLAEVGAEGSLQATSVAMTLTHVLAAQRDIEGVLAVLLDVRRQFLARKGTARNVCEVTLFIVQTLLELQRPVEAQQELAAMRASCAEVEAEPGPLTHSLIATEARTALVVGDFETARSRALEALELGGVLVPQGHPHDHVNRVVLSAAQAGLGRVDEALASLAFGAAPAEAVYGRASVEYFKLRRIGVELLVRAGRHDEADAYARATLELLPPDTAEPIPEQWHEALVIAGARLDAP
jgi:tetratricopeptide (TPR) repeat protein